MRIKLFDPDVVSQKTCCDGMIDVRPQASGRIPTLAVLPDVYAEASSFCRTGEGTVPCSPFNASDDRAFTL